MKLGPGLGLTGGQGAPLPAIDLTAPSAQSLDASLVKPDQGVVFINTSDTSPQTQTNNSVYFAATFNDASSNRIILNQTSTGGFKLRADSGSVNSVDFDSADEMMIDERRAMALRYGSFGMELYYNGMKLFKDSSFTPPAALNKAAVGQFTEGSLGLDADVSLEHFKYFDTALSPDIARALTRKGFEQSGVTYDGTRDMIGFLGQSNSSGRGSGSFTYTNTSLIKMLHNDGTIDNYSDPYDDNTGEEISTFLSDTGTGLSYAGKVIDDLAGASGRTTVAVPANEGGTSFDANDWVADAVFSGGEALGAQLWAAIVRLQKAAVLGQLRAIVWHQGESDAVAGVSKAAYKAAWTKMADEIRAALGVSVPFVICTLHQWDSSIAVATESNWNTISDALDELGSEYSNAVGVDLSDIAGASGDRLHLGSTGLSTAAGRISTAIQSVW